MKQITAGIVAHVDAGKTTLSEAMLYEAGNLRKLGRVDNGDAFLDPDNLEKKRGITIFSHEAQLETDNFKMILLDTPGHMDFASQTEEVLSVLDYAILVISATDGVTSYTRTLWNLLKRYGIPCFIFINKMDAPDVDKDKIIADVQKNLADNCFDFSDINDDFYENVATVDEKLLEQYLNDGIISDNQIKSLIAKRTIFPIYFGSALKLQGVNDFIAGIEKWAKVSEYSEKFAARIFKISHDERGNRLTWLKVLGGQLKAKIELFPDEKIDQIRDYDGTKYQVISVAKAGDVVAVTGLSSTYPGQGVNVADIANSLKPVLTYRVNPGKNDIYKCLDALKILEDEDPNLHIKWSEHLQEIHLQIMGKIQLEILQQILAERFDLNVTFDQGSILYKETITQKIEAVGHFEPLRHYSETHLLLEPGKENSGVVFENDCSLEVLDKNWQHQIMTALTSKEHLGVLTGSPITDMKITLIGGRASNVHTVGGDFREASYRAVRQGLMELKIRNACKLLEPWYSFRLEIPAGQVGRALNDIQRMNGKFNGPEDNGRYTVIIGQAPVSEMQDYANEVRSYTHGEGYLECVVLGYRDCHNSEKIIAEKNYDPVSDLENTPNSVFCSHGAGHTVTWDKVPEAAQFPYTYPLN
ncbi:TetM/TetW/TetO/TetS family tetracycline resistance ribosomal protection protein [Lactobacillus hamsteri]|uniref:elongation factor G n=1 Tax=Lactobacillus hamsteri TaxID=96565 RepID=UPI000469DD48|nr:TetM/TetW/TetO/TetS family tetracycline resistance ribosomal protection protein [Lactobacillus hamsteri]